MDFRKIDDSISVAPQLSVADVAEAARLGFKTLVANRPDQEEFGQPAMADIEAAAREHGLEWVYMPVESGNITDDDIDRFAPMIRAAEKPVLAFCRSGTRCTVLWALSAARDTSAQEIFTKARNAGYDISGLAPRLAQQSSAHQ
ncbi:TIGR01244 family sulfur transferase [Marinobacter qingdaonensis]|jgi:sulfide:quinone oxidoreductase|uniref:TIGR01244 family sulfur transferase n=1 Tax=Marinobacter qingdaonensis TaxID=3108486 RepID=A0ABU5P1N1_9GAMM|nr:TIGR01244 family sulfur transferase [Marinobacter sp. ASW11-75]MEA1081983.1 TIGR01244 family sulfur transferase [Marinobacter sp. ASW11-75]MEE3117905.1 TIGR01244 family sulfur transferase [Pseudomonadota bacterium]